MPDLKAYLAANYMSGPKADAILARSDDPTIKKKRKKVKNEDYIGGSSHRGEDSMSRGLVRDEDDWKGEEEIDFDAEDAPGEHCFNFHRACFCGLPYSQS